MSKRSQVIVGIDASSKAIAYSVIDNDKVVGVVKVHLVGATTTEKCKSAYKVGKSINKHIKPDLVAIEAAVFVNNRQVVIMLAGIFGALSAAFDCPVHQVAPVSWMNHIGTNIRGTKADMINIQKEIPGKSKSWYKSELRKRRKQHTMDILSELYSISLNDDDIADSLGIAKYCYDELRER